MEKMSEMPSPVVASGPVAVGEVVGGCVGDGASSPQPVLKPASTTAAPPEPPQPRIQTTLDIARSLSAAMVEALRAGQCSLICAVRSARAVDRVTNEGHAAAAHIDANQSGNATIDGGAGGAEPKISNT